MKYYGFKFKSFRAEKSQLNRHVSTWLGLIGTLIFLVSAAESGGFRGSLGEEHWLTVVYPASLWFISLLGIEHKWIRTLLIIVSGLASLLAGLAISYLWFEKHRMVFSLVLLFILNIGVFYLAFRKDSSGLAVEKKS